MPPFSPDTEPSGEGVIVLDHQDVLRGYLKAHHDGEGEGEGGEGDGEGGQG